MKAKDWTHLFPKFAGLWVAFGKDEETVVSSAKSLKNTVKRAEEKGFKMPLLFKVPSEFLPYVGSF
ncbi:hypothetical protein KKE48_00310 [Patescibacteria group bacterium]|nr:hypothetical protein [Patescibacteria group bacterium]MBU1499298.1 hypothetical protein [Patescibacteria group bacterium]